MNEDPLRRRAAFQGALLFLVGMLTGLFSALALTNKVKTALPHLALAAHLNALLGAFWLFGLAFTLPMLSYGERGKSRLVMLTLVPAWGNWLVTLVASFVGERGIEFNDSTANNGVAAALQALVVIPTLFSAAAWVNGFRGKPAGS